MHWCQDETNALLAMLPFVGFALVWLRMKLGLLKPAKPACGCGSDHGTAVTKDGGDGDGQDADFRSGSPVRARRG